MPDSENHQYEKDIERENNFYPRPKIQRLMQLCAGFEDRGEEVLKLIKRLGEVLQSASEKFPMVFEDNQEQCSHIQADLEDLLPRLMITKVTLSVNYYPLSYWQEVVAKGMMLDVFSEGGLKAIGERINQAYNFANETMAFLNEVLHPGDDLAPTDQAA